MQGTKQSLGHTGGNTHGHRLWGHRRLRLCRVLPIRLVLIVTEMADLPLDADEVGKKGVVPVALSCQSEKGEAPTTATTGDADA